MPAALSTVIQETACSMLAAGEYHKDIAAKLDVHPKTIQRIKNAQQDKIIQLATKYVNDSTELIYQNHIRTLTIANTILTAATDHPDSPGNQERTQIIANLAKAGVEARDILKLSDLKEFRTLQIMGIIPGNTTSLVINQILGNVSVNLVDAGVRQLLGAQLNQLEDQDEVIEAEVLGS